MYLPCIPLPFAISCDVSDGRAVKTNHRSKITAKQLIDMLRKKLNIVISDDEARELFAEWDKDGNGYLDVEEFVDIIMPNDIDEKEITYIGKDVQDFSKSVSTAAKKPPVSASQSMRQNNVSLLTAEEMRQLVRDKLFSRLSIQGNCFQYQKMFKLLNDGESSRLISRSKMRNKLVAKFGIDLPNEDFDKLFDKMDADGSGYIDTKEFLEFMIIKDYGNAGNMPWEATKSGTFDIRPPECSVAQSDVMKNDASFHHLKEIPQSMRSHKWTVDEIQQMLWDKIQERLPIQGNCHQYQRIYRMFCEDLNKGLVPRTSITKEILQDKLITNFGIQISDGELDELFALYDTDGNGEIDIFEFINVLVPPEFKGHLPYQEVGPLVDDLEPVNHLIGLNKYDPMAPEDPASLRKFKPNAEELERRVREKVLGRSGGAAFTFKDMFVKLKAGMRAAPELQGMVTPKALQIILRTQFGITCDDNEIELLWARYDKNGEGKMPVRQMAAAFLPQDTDGTHHLTPKSNQDNQVGSDVRAHLFDLMGKTAPGSSLMGGGISRTMEGGSFSRPSTAPSSAPSEVSDGRKSVSIASTPGVGEPTFRSAKPRNVPNPRLYQTKSAKGPYPVSWAARRPTSSSRWRRPSSAGSGRSPRKHKQLNQESEMVPGLSISGQTKGQEDRSELIGAARPQFTNPTPRSRQSSRNAMISNPRGRSALDEAYAMRISSPRPSTGGSSRMSMTRKLVHSPIKYDGRFAASYTRSG